MKARLVRTKTSGQSLPLIALMIVVLVAMVGLAVDVGNTYAEQRNTVRSSNAAALAGMNLLIKGGDDSSVYNAISQSLASNKIKVAAPGAQPADGERALVANYLDSSGNPLVSCPTVGSCDDTVPQGVTYIRVEVKGQVDTFFARVVNTNSLPVGANAWAAKGACTSGIYPIAVRDQWLGQNGFANPDSVYNDSIYRNKTVKRIYLHDPALNPNGGFNWLRWTSGQGSGTDLVGMLTGGGNIDQGFEEALWPQPGTISGQTIKPLGYPLQPGMLSSGDWIYGNSGVSNSSNARAQLDAHITNRTEMILPIWDDNAGQGNGATYHISRMATFLILGYNLSGNFNGNNPDNWGYIDLVYIGNAGECATLVTPPARNNNVGIAGQVFFRPRTKVVPQSRPPVQYEIILDVSGSMSLNFAGQAGSSGHATLCMGVAWTDPCDNGWSQVSQRRIYIAKHAIDSFIDNMQQTDTMRIVSFSGGPIAHPNNQNAINELTSALPASGWTSDKATLHQAVQDAGAVGNAYKTAGRTPSATGLAAGKQVLGAAPAKAPDGQSYKRVVIFMTDGVANIFRDGSQPNYTGQCATGSTEVASCNVGYTSGNPAVAKPITAMILESDTLKQTADTVYVIALAGVDETGLKTVASAPNYPFFSSSQNGSDLQGIFDSIATNVKTGTCAPSGGNTWKRSMNESELGDVAPPDGPLSFPVVGKVYLYDQNGNVLPNGKGVGQVQVDAQTGAMTYSFADLTPGAYQLRGFVAYRGADDVSRIYNQIYNPNTATIDNAISFPVDPSTALGTILPVAPMYLDMSGSVCPNS